MATGRGIGVGREGPNELKVVFIFIIPNRRDPSLSPCVILCVACFRSFGFLKAHCITLSDSHRWVVDHVAGLLRLAVLRLFRCVRVLVFDARQVQFSGQLAGHFGVVRLRHQMEERGGFRVLVWFVRKASLRRRRQLSCAWRTKRVVGVWGWWPAKGARKLGTCWGRRVHGWKVF